MPNGRLSLDERRKAEHSTMSVITTQQLEMLLPLVCGWAVGQERAVVQSGVALSESQLADARRAGVAQPERVRLLRVAHRGVDLISDALPFGRLWYGER